MVEDHSDQSASIGAAKSTLDQDSSVAMMRHDPSSGRSRGGGGGGISSFCNFVLTQIFFFFFFFGGGGGGSSTSALLSDLCSLISIQIIAKEFPQRLLL